MTKEWTIRKEVKRFVTATFFMLVVLSINPVIASTLCSIANTSLFENPSEKLEELQTERLSTKCAQSWSVTTPKGIVSLPAGLNVVRLSKHDQSQILFHFQGQVQEGLISKIAFEGTLGCAQGQNHPNRGAFFEEATFQSDLAQRINSHSNPSFDRAVKELGESLDLKKISQRQFLSMEKRWQQKISKTQFNKVKQVQHFKDMIQNVYDPSQILDSTLLVPLSRQWFESGAELSQFWQKTWLNSGFDLRIMAGASGEGVSFDPRKSDFENESFLQMESLMEATSHFIQNEARNKRLKQSPEAKWLLAQIKIGLKSYKRMIFFSPKTWTNNSQTTKWADYVPVDQSLGGLSSDYLLSVMIHEINVNSHNFLSSDTHSEMNDSMILRDCVKKNGASALSLDPVTLQKVFGYNPQIAVVYLKMILAQ
jgi:hypothetical protein